ncbi:hypothetical protein J6TS7_43500 [Paenibacillus dendritiformis]|nr:hypothetical protein [Paenibacillus dendritiformis]MEB9895833.1 hypothetical protein [Bacillus cereus]GIO80740.1 hypothetical protein J6TS7_43500 [Paenibacillus dendritiformis]CAH8721808.1 hypothetical protein HTL2_006546 [Paenibacillus melissococcoides]
MARNGNGTGGGNKKNGKKKSSPSKLTPQQIAVVVGLLANALEVTSVLIDKNQRIEIVLEGSIRKKTRADRIAEELNNISVGDLLEAILLQKL